MSKTLSSLPWLGNMLSRSYGVQPHISSRHHTQRNVAATALNVSRRDVIEAGAAALLLPGNPKQQQQLVCEAAAVNCSLITAPEPAATGLIDEKILLPDHDMLMFCSNCVVPPAFWAFASLQPPLASTHAKVQTHTAHDAKVLVIHPSRRHAPWSCSSSLRQCLQL